ncbi:MAG TPA: bifunctional [glutamine synthetase] adenylyltransferase/[glutamine synthetase]-adenylyl-L-tyrosine phosphorylase [Acidimicrobiales bacterium]|nr:bifunctional [glutamine synthetase] adenylyltransferase/[glutamine synthetase]-adenylyl-L-tyrosine phosphorylase [Acidimicrobiales bacterium]
MYLPPEAARSADPAAVSRAVERILEANPSSEERLRDDPGLRRAVVAVTAASPWLARVCSTDPLALDALSGSPVPRYGAEADLGRLKALGLLGIAARDLLGTDGLEEVGVRLSDLADGLLDIACRSTTTPGELAVIAMGKLGGRELNYASDIDIVLVTGDGVQPLDARAFLDLARTAWKVDLDLRPEGRAGPLARTLSSYVAYWDRWAQPWEFQALLKARPAAGDAKTGELFAAEAERQVWKRPFGAEQLGELRRMKARAENEIARHGLTARELKRGAGGIRDVEFSVQLLQLVHGRSDPALRERSTLKALSALTAGGYVASEDAAALEDAYRFLRGVEHRLQLYEGQPVYTVPTDNGRRAHLARVMGFRDGRTSALAQFDAELRRHRAAVRSIHERLFFRPLLEVFTSAAGNRPLSESAAEDRLLAFGFADTARTRQAVAQLTRGVTRTSRLMQQMLPLLLDWLSSSPSPDVGLLALRTLADGPHTRDLLTAVCRESPAGARQLCQLLGTGPTFARAFQRHPESLGELARGTFLDRPTRRELDRRLASSIAWRAGGEAIAAGLRVFGDLEKFRVAARDVLGAAGVRETGSSLTDLAEAVLAAALAHAEPPVPVAIIAMGRFGGRELAYASDLDLMVVHDVPPGWTRQAAARAAEEVWASVRSMVAGPTPATALYRLDLGLRPEGRHGPTVRSLESYSMYYERWAKVWERQALLRGRLAAGDQELGRRFGDAARRFVWERPLSADAVTEIRRLKARMEKERVPPGEDAKFHLKLGPGSLSDVEWTVQLLQLRHGVAETGTLAALDALRSAGVVGEADATILSDSYVFCEQVRNRLALVREVAGDSLPTAGPALESLARSLGRSPSGLRDEYARVTRRARRVVERLFYGRPL